MAKILIVEDNANKLQKIIQAMLVVNGVELADITHVISGTDAKRELTQTFFDLLVLDIAIPERIDQEVSSDGGLDLLNEVLARDKYKQPAHVVGITSYEDIYARAAERFSRESLSVIYYDQTSDEWSTKLQAKIRQIVLSNRDRIREGLTDHKDEPSPQRCALVMKGGGVKTLAYIGALRIIERYYTFDWFIGTSAGAIAAALLGAGYSRTELENILREKRFTDFLDSPYYMLPINLIVHKGLYHARAFTSWLDTLIAQKLNSATRVKLGELPHRVTIYASRRGKKALVFDSNDPRTADVAISHAVRCSMSIPLFFVPARDEGLRVFDGGMQNNYPVEHLLGSYPNIDFVGLYLGSEVFEGEEREPSIWRELLSIWSESNDTEALEKYRDKTIVIDPRPISTTDFKLSAAQKEFLVSAGELAALRFFFAHRTQDDAPMSAEISLAEGKLSQARAAMLLPV
jgi:predicted acylesterase/phospholipase RssA